MSLAMLYWLRRRPAPMPAGPTVPCSRLAGRACRRITRRRLILIGVAFLTGCGPSWTVRHWDVTIEVDTPAGPRNGRGVVETRARERNEVLYTLDSAQLIVHGGAIAVALRNR